MRVWEIYCKLPKSVTTLELVRGCTPSIPGLAHAAHEQKGEVYHVRKSEKEIETIKDRTLILKLSDADCDRILQKAAGCGLTVSELLASFIGDLIDGTYTNGSDERMLAQDWFDRCGFRQMADRTLLRFCWSAVRTSKIFICLR